MNRVKSEGDAVLFLRTVACRREGPDRTTASTTSKREVISCRGVHDRGRNRLRPNCLR